MYLGYIILEKRITDCPLKKNTQIDEDCLSLIATPPKQMTLFQGPKN